MALDLFSIPKKSSIASQFAELYQLFTACFISVFNHELPLPSDLAPTSRSKHVNCGWRQPWCRFSIIFHHVIAQAMPPTGEISIPCVNSCVCGDDELEISLASFPFLQHPHTLKLYGRKRRSVSILKQSHPQWSRTPARFKPFSLIDFIMTSEQTSTGSKKRSTRW